MLQECGIGSGTVDSLKQGKKPTATILATIANYLNVPTDFLLRNTGIEYSEEEVNIIYNLRFLTRKTFDANDQLTLHAVATPVFETSKVDEFNYSGDSLNGHGGRWGWQPNTYTDEFIISLFKDFVEEGCELSEHEQDFFNYIYDKDISKMSQIPRYLGI